jgi:hypothetical protein
MSIFLQIITKYLLYASWWIIMVFLEFVLPNSLLSSRDHSTYIIGDI